MKVDIIKTSENDNKNKEISFDINIINIYLKTKFGFEILNYKDSKNQESSLFGIFGNKEFMFFDVIWFRFKIY